MKAAITESDNAAAESLWAQLGDPPAAAQQVQQVLQEAGDPTASNPRLQTRIHCFRPDHMVADQSDPVHRNGAFCNAQMVRYSN